MENEGIDNIHKHKSKTELLDEAEKEINLGHAKLHEGKEEVAIAYTMLAIKKLIEAMR